MATVATDALGPHSDVMTMQEASLRIFCHDVFSPTRFGRPFAEERGRRQAYRLRATRVTVADGPTRRHVPMASLDPSA